jgi:hypothetical protein
MSGPVEVGEGRLTTVGGIPVQRSLPQRGRRTVGAWCFVDQHGLVVVDGPVTVDGALVAPGAFAYVGPGHDEIDLAPAAGDAPARALLLGGAPFDEPILMWWNFVARTREEMVQARQDWEAVSDRFGAVETELGRIAAPPPLWDRPGMQPVQK